VSQLLVGLTAIQQVGYFTLFALAFALGFKLLIGLHLFAILFTFLLNLCSLGVYLFLINDPVFTHTGGKKMQTTKTAI
jgi:hypothetical protein